MRDRVRRFYCPGKTMAGNACATLLLTIAAKNTGGRIRVQCPGCGRWSVFGRPKGPKVDTPIVAAVG